MKRNRGESIGTVDHPFDDDRPGSHRLIQSDAACAIPWLADGFQSVEIFVEPSLTQRAPEICTALGAVTAERKDLDSLIESIQRYAEGAGLTVSVYPNPRDQLGTGNIAVAVSVA